jgi:hypothetical protein
MHSILRTACTSDLSEDIWGNQYDSPTAGTAKMSYCPISTGAPSISTAQNRNHLQSFGYAATTSSITSAPAGSDAAANAVRAGNGVMP